MRATLLGIENISYNKKTTGELVSAVNLHCAYVDNRVNGQKCQAVFVSDNLGFRSLINTFRPGIEVDLDYAPNGQLYDLRAIGNENPYSQDSKASQDKK